MVRTVLATKASWSGEGGVERRQEYFAAHLGHADRTIHELAYLELARAPYSWLRRLGRSVARETYLPMLDQLRYAKWQSLAILLLAQSEDPTDQERIRESLRAAHKYRSTLQLAAWTTAAIEVDGVVTLEFIEEQYLSGLDHSGEELDAVAQALSVQGSGGVPALRERIVGCYARLLEHSPRFAPTVATDLLAWERTELTGALGEILARSTDLEASDHETTTLESPNFESSERRAIERTCP